MKRLLFALLFTGATLAQNPETAIFPAAIATDETLLVAKDNAWSTLNGAINDSTLTVVVWDGSRFAYPSVVKIGNEFLKVCSIATNTLTICSGGRGFAGTTSASHNSGVLIEDVWMAKHHNLPMAEIKAIETALGANLAHPLNKGTSLPATCAIGDLFYKTDATAGQNVYGCTATDTWTLQSGSTPTALTQPTPADTEGAFPMFSGPGRETQQSCWRQNPSTGAFENFCSSDPFALLAKHLTGSLDEPASGFTWFGYDLTTGAPAWRVNGGVQQTAQPSSAALTAITASAPDFSGMTTTKPVKSGTSPPGTCAVGEYFYDTDATAGQNTYACTSTNTWTLQGGGGSGSTTDYLTLWTYSWTGGGTSVGPAAFHCATSNGCIPSTIGSSPSILYASEYADGANELTGTFFFNVPSWWDGATVGLTLGWTRGATGSAAATVKWDMATACRGVGEDVAAPSYNAEQTMGGTTAVETILVHTTNSSLTMTGCAAGEVMYLKVARDANDASDTFTGSAHLLYARLAFGRTL